MYQDNVGEDSEKLRKYFNGDIIGINCLNHTGNNQIFEVVTGTQKLILKKYSKRNQEVWDRCEKEYTALRYLWGKGFREIPEPIKMFKEDRVAIYGFVEGLKPKIKELDKLDIQKAADFLIKLHRIDNKDKNQFGLASSACVNLKEYLNVLDKRLYSFKQYFPTEGIQYQAKELIESKVIPQIQRIKNDFLMKIKGKDINQELLIDEQVLTPADYGFHNILKDKDNLRVIDFEYFGRDDPARQIMDFIHHDKSAALDIQLKKDFIEYYVSSMNKDEEFISRLKLIDPLIGMTWVLISLNKFGNKINEDESVLCERLSKAKSKLENLLFF